MQRRRLIGRSLVLAFGLAVAAPAMAQTVVVPSVRSRVVPPDEVLAIVRSNSFSPLERPVRRGVTYALRAVSTDGEQVRIIVDAHTGAILAVTALQAPPLAPGPGVAAAPLAPGPNVRRMPNAPPDDDDVVAVPPAAPRVAPARPPVVYEQSPPRVYGSRPPGQVPAQPGVVVPPAAEPQIIEPEPNPSGMLPPPPERFPQRVAPAAEPRPKAPARKQTVAAPPKAPPLPRPKPENSVTPSPPSPAPAAAPAAPTLPPLVPPPPAAKPADDDVPH